MFEMVEYLEAPTRTVTGDELRTRKQLELVVSKARQNKMPGKADRGGGVEWMIVRRRASG